MTPGRARPVRRKLPLIHRLIWALLFLSRGSSAASIVYPMVQVETTSLSTGDDQTTTAAGYEVTGLQTTPTEDTGVIVDVVVVTSNLPATSTTPPRGLPAIVQDAVVVPQDSPDVSNAEASVVIKVVPIVSANASTGPGAVGVDTHVTFEPDTNTEEPTKTKRTRLQKQFTNKHMSKYVVKNCGIPHARMRRIVGGKLTTLERYPWTVGVWMRFGEKPYCGGVIVSWLFVMTAGHCTRNKMAQDLRVSFGVTHINHARLKSDEKDHLIEVEAIYQNPLFKDIVHGDDISILKMSSPLQEGGYPVTPICIPEATGTPITTADIVGTDGVVAGWGRTTYGGESSKQLREVALPIVSNKACAKVFKDVLKIRDEMICAGDINGTKDACQGDSGGALMWRSKADDRWYALGVVSFGVKCAEPGYYGTYTRVQSYLVWICKVTDGLLCFGSSSNEAGVQLPSNSTKDKEE
ncbi:clotting factor G beta subunit-like [Amblyomma americanum]